MNDRIVRMARAIQEFEGWYPGSRSYRNNNPGNLRRWNGYPTRDGYVVFPDFWTGFRALYRLIERALAGTSKIYRPDMTLSEFFARYAPAADGNYPAAYAAFVARRLGVSPDATLRDALRSPPC